MLAVLSGLLLYKKTTGYMLFEVELRLSPSRLLQKTTTIHNIFLMSLLEQHH